MVVPQRQPAAIPQIGKAPSTGHPARVEPVVSPPPERAPTVDDPLVNFGGRIRTSTRRRMRLYAAGHDREIQDLLEEALTEWLDRNGG